MVNKQNAQPKKTWITPELMMETVEGTEGKVLTSIETTTPTDGLQFFGPS